MPDDSLNNIMHTLSPKMVETSANSNMVGTMLNTIAVSTKLIPRDPRSIFYKQKTNI